MAVSASILPVFQSYDPLLSVYTFIPMSHDAVLITHPMSCETTQNSSYLSQADFEAGLEPSGARPLLPPECRRPMMRRVMSQM